MPGSTKPRDSSNKLEELLQQVPPAEWVRGMVEHYRRTGSYRPQDLRRLLGDPTKGVEVSNHASLTSCFAEQDTIADS